MATTVLAGSSSDYTIPAGRTGVFTSTGEGLVRTKAGASGGGFETRRVTAAAEVLMGPFSNDVVVTVIGTSGVTTAKTRRLVPAMVYEDDGVTSVGEAGPAGFYPVSGYRISASGDLTGVADTQSLTAALAAMTVAGGGSIELAPGTYYTDLAGAAARFVPSNTTIFCRQPGSAVIKRAGTAGNYGNQLTLNGVSNVVIDGIDFDGNRSVVTGLPASDANGNGIRIVNTKNWTVRNCRIRNQPFHGIIGVQSCDGFTIENVTATGNGYRSMHIHSEANAYARRGLVRNVRSYGNGAHPNHAWSGTATTTAASAVVTLQAGDGALWAAMFSAAGGAGQCYFIMPGAGTSGATLIETVASVNSGANQITLTRAAPTAVTSGRAQGIGELASGIFLTYGSDDVHFSDIHCANEPGWGIQFVGSVDTLLTNVYQCLGTVTATLNKLFLSATDYTAFKAAYNALSAGNKALTTINVDGAGADYNGLISAITAFNDADSSITLTTSATYPVTNARVISTYSVGSGGNFKAPSTCQTIKGLTIDGCGMGMRVENLADVSFSGLKISNSLVHHIWHDSGSGVVYDPTCSLTNAGALGIYMNAAVDSTGNSFHGRIHGCGGIGINMTAAANKRLMNTVIGPSAVIENCGQNAHFRQATNMIGAVAGCGIYAHNDNGNGLVEAPRIFGAEIARNWLGGVKFTAAVNGVVSGCRIYDNVDPSATSAGTATGKGAQAVLTQSNCGRLEVINNDFNCRDLINDSYTLDVSSGTTTARVLFNRLELETRNAGGGNVAFGHATQTVHYGNWLHATATWSGAGVTTIPAV